LHDDVEHARKTHKKSKRQKPKKTGGRANFLELFFSVTPEFIIVIKNGRYH